MMRLGEDLIGEIYKFLFLDKCASHTTKYESGLDWEDLEEIYESYYKKRFKELSPQEIAKRVYYSYLLLKEIGIKLGAP